MAKNLHFDFIIVGNGLAGLQLAVKMASDSFFSNKQIALIDPSKKDLNDKTWSFWETETSQWKQIIYKSWKQASIITSKKTTLLNLQPYFYKTIRAIDFYTEAKLVLKQHKNFQFINETVQQVIDDGHVEVKTEKNTFYATHVFDSRIPEQYFSSKKHITLTQHFKGWFVNTVNNHFNESTATMMDFRVKDGHQTCFTYVLPFSKTEALIEFTYFTETVVEEQVYDKFIEEYIENHLQITNFKIVETEKGQIPMTNFPFDKYNTKNITKIGTAGGWVKGSTGYSFKNTEKKVSKIIENIKTNKTPSLKLSRKKYKFYDTVFLKVLKDENHKGEWIFSRFYGKNSVETIFRFLDEESSFSEDLKIMKSLLSWSFIKAFFKTL